MIKKYFSNRNIILLILFSIALIATGIIQILIPSILITVISYLYGFIFLFCAGMELIKILFSIKKGEYSFSLLAIYVMSAIWLLSGNNNALSLIYPTIFSIIITAIGAYDIQFSFRLRLYRVRNWWELLVLGIFNVIFGIAFMVVVNLDNRGIWFILAGLVGLIKALFYYKNLIFLTERENKELKKEQ